MNRSSEYSSGCESGWTTYFDQLSNFTDTYSRACITTCEDKGTYMMSEDQEDEDLSTISDATSGPSNLQKHRGRKKGKTKSSSKENFSKKQQSSLCLDDTASSPSIHFSQNESTTPNYYQEDIFAAAYLQDESTSKKQTSFPKHSKGKSVSSLGMKRH